MRAFESNQTVLCHHPLGVTIANTKSRVTIHMVASLDGFIARKDGSVDWLETSDTFEGGDTMSPEFVAEFLKTIDCYVMGSRTYETALDFEAKGLGWSYGDKPTFVLTHRHLPKTRDTVEFCSGDLTHLVNERLKPAFSSIWVVIPSAFGIAMTFSTSRSRVSKEFVLATADPPQGNAASAI